MRPWIRELWTNTADHTALASFTSEASLLAGTNNIPVFGALFFDGKDKTGLWFELEATGIVSCTGTPTYTFGVRMGPLGTVSDPAIGVSAAITMQSGVTTKWWKMYLRAILRSPAQGATNSSISVDGYVMSPGGFAAPYIYPLEPTTPDTATWTASAFSSLVQNYLQVSVACSASSASNTITLKNGTVRTNG